MRSLERRNVARPAVGFSGSETPAKLVEAPRFTALCAALGSIENPSCNSLSQCATPQLPPECLVLLPSARHPPRVQRHSYFLCNVLRLLAGVLVVTSLVFVLLLLLPSQPAPRTSMHGDPNGLRSRLLRWVRKSPLQALRICFAPYLQGARKQHYCLVPGVGQASACRVPHAGPGLSSTGLGAFSAGCSSSLQP